MLSRCNGKRCCTQRSRRQTARGRLDSSLDELQSRELRVNASEFHQLIVSALLNNAAAVQDDDAIGLTDRGQAVGNDEGGTPFHQPVQRLLDRLLPFSVYRR